MFFGAQKEVNLSLKMETLIMEMNNYLMSHELLEHFPIYCKIWSKHLFNPYTGQNKVFFVKFIL